MDSITGPELEQGFEQLGMGAIPEKYLDTIFNEFDMDKSGRIQYEELRSILQRDKLDVEELSPEELAHMRGEPWPPSRRSSGIRWRTRTFATAGDQGATQPENSRESVEAKQRVILKTHGAPAPLQQDPHCSAGRRSRHMTLTRTARCTTTPKLSMLTN